MSPRDTIAESVYPVPKLDGLEEKRTAEAVSGRDTFAESVYSDPKFHQLVKKRRNVSVGLFAICMILFFLIPVISSLCPEVFRIRVVGSINVGLLYMVAQYAIGGLIAWSYASQLVHIDEQYKQLVTRFQDASMHAAK